MTINRRMAALAMSLVFALIAGISILVYLKGENARSVAGQEAVQVWMVDKAIPRGTSMTVVKKDGYVSKQFVPVRSAPNSFAVDLGADNTVAASDIAVGEILMQGRFVAETAIGPQALAVPGGHVAVSATLKDFQRVGSFVKPGDFVAVYQYSSHTARVIFSRVQVLGVGDLTETGKSKNDAAVPSAVMTLSLTPKDAAALVVAANNGDTSLQFALLPAGASAPLSASSIGK
jgi:Flp pilus assembly protein CpaB